MVPILFHFKWAIIMHSIVEAYIMNQDEYKRMMDVIDRQRKIISQMGAALRTIRKEIIESEITWRFVGTLEMIDSAIAAEEKEQL